MKGHVKFFNENKGFGFINVDDEDKDYFVHQSDIKTDDGTLHDNEAVTFDVVDGERGPKAANVKLAKSDSSEEKADDSADTADETEDLDNSTEE